jgi:hypothetical protein
MTSRDDLIRELARVELLVRDLLHPDHVGADFDARQRLELWLLHIEADIEDARRDIKASAARRAAERAAEDACARGIAHCVDWPLCGHTQRSETG